MNCCDYNCNQGRNCPIRSTPVARIGRRDYGLEPMPPTTWRDTLKSLAVWVVYGIIGLFWLAYVVAVVRWAHA